MKVEVEHAKLVRARTRLEDLASTVESEARRAVASSPIGLPSLAPLDAKVRWMRDQLPELEAWPRWRSCSTRRAGPISFETPGPEWDVVAMFDAVVAQRFGPDFAESTGLTEDEFRA